MELLYVKRNFSVLESPISEGVRVENATPLRYSKTEPGSRLRFYKSPGISVRVLLDFDITRHEAVSIDGSVTTQIESHFRTAICRHDFAVFSSGAVKFVIIIQPGSFSHAGFHVNPNPFGL
jgi:hypothetical protein